MNRHLTFIALSVVLLSPAISVGSKTDSAPDSIPVTWDYGSGPGRMSERYTGTREIDVHYKPASCRDSVRIQSIRHEFATAAGGDPKLAGQIFFIATLRKHAAGDIRLPTFEITQNKLSEDGEITGETEIITLAFPDFMAKQQAKDWNASGFEFELFRPDTELYNPLDWMKVEVVCTNHLTPIRRPAVKRANVPRRDL